MIKNDEHPITTNYVGAATWVGYFNASFFLQFSGSEGWWRWIINIYTYSHTFRAEIDQNGNMINPRYVNFTVLSES